MSTKKTLGLGLSVASTLLWVGGLSGGCSSSTATDPGDAASDAKRLEGGQIDLPDSGSCTPSDSVKSFDFGFKPTLHAKACSDEALSTFQTQWIQGDAAASSAWEAANAACFACVVTAEDAPAWGPFVTRTKPRNGITVNRAAQVELSGGSLACAKATLQVNECSVYACLLNEACNGAGATALQQCADGASASTCREWNTASTTACTSAADQAAFEKSRTFSLSTLARMLCGTGSADAGDAG